MTATRLTVLFSVVLAWPLVAVAADEISDKAITPRTRRILYNLDGDSCLWTKKNAKTPVHVTPDDLKTVVDEIAFPGSRVDTLLVCINAQCVYYPTKIEEAVNRYDCDGIELDFNRFPTFFKDTLAACLMFSAASAAAGAPPTAAVIHDDFSDGNVLGMSPEPKVAYVPNPRQEGYTHPTPATPAQLIAAKSLWMMATQVNREIQQLVASLLSPTVEATTCEYSVGVGLGRTEHPIHCLLKPHTEGGCVLLTVNLEDAVQTVRFTFSGKLASLEKLFENQPAPALSAGGRTFDDRFEPFEVHVYRLKL